MAAKRGTGTRGLLVLGMHRSGTSATASALEAAGFRLGDRLIEGAQDNPQGYFEHAGVVEVHERLLGALDRAWDDIRALPAGWLDSRAAKAAADTLGAILDNELAGPIPWVVKDPRACRLLPLWQRVLGPRGIRPACLFVVRHPDEVAASLMARDRLPGTAAHLLWLRHMVEAEAESREWPRVVVPYSALLQAPEDVLGGALQALGLHAPRGLDKAIARVDVASRHHAGGAARAMGAWHALATEAYQATLSAGSVDALADAGGRLRALAREQDDWIEVAGALQASSEARISRWKREASDAAQRADGLQGRVEELGALALSRLAEVEALDKGLGAATSLADARLGELREATARVAQAEEAKRVAEGVVEGLRKEASALADALAEAQAFAEERLAALAQAQDRIRAVERMLGEARTEAEALTRQVRAERDARVDAEGLVDAARASAAAESQARANAERLLRESRAHAEGLVAGAAAEAGARSRAEALLAAARTQLDELQAVRHGAEALARDRLATIEALDRRIRDTEAAKELAEQLAYARQEEIEGLASEVGRLIDALRDLAQHRDQLAETLAHMRQGRWWRLGRRLRISTDPADRG